MTTDLRPPADAPAGGRRRARPAALARRRPDRGSLSVELAILFPAVLLLLFGAVQAGLWFQARNLCHGAAQAGVRAGTAERAGSGAGSGAAAGYLRDVAGALVVAPAVSESRTAATLTVTCSGQALMVIPLPGFSIEVRQSATGGIERFTTP